MAHMTTTPKTPGVRGRSTSRQVRIAKLFDELKGLLEEEGILDQCRGDDTVSGSSAPTGTVEDGELSELQRMAAEDAATLIRKRRQPATSKTSARGSPRPSATPTRR